MASAECTRTSICRRYQVMSCFVRRLACHFNKVPYNRLQGLSGTSPDKRMDSSSSLMAASKLSRGIPRTVPTLRQLAQLRVEMTATTKEKRPRRPK